jgi:LysM repeat protein
MEVGMVQQRVPQVRQVGAPRRPARPPMPPNRPQGSVRRGLSRAWLWVLLGSGASLACVLVVGGVLLLIVSSAYSNGSILPRVRVEDTPIGAVSLGGMSQQEAEEELRAVPVSGNVIFRYGERTWQIPASEFGIRVDAPATAEVAAGIGRNGLMGFTRIFSNTRIVPLYTLDLVSAENTLNNISADVNDRPKATTPGHTLNVSATLDRVPGDLSALLRGGGVIDLVVDEITGPRTTYTVQRGEELALIAKKFNVEMSEIIELNGIEDANLIYPGQELIIPATGEYQPTDEDAPEPPTNEGKAIVVSISNQRIYAYENGKLVHSTLTSTGRVGTDTVIGDFAVYVKYEVTRMRGPDYDIPDVPYTMYFYRGYGIHGAYWHNSFGRQMSHGCVNLPTSEAKWFFDWASVGTPVRVVA